MALGFEGMFVVEAQGHSGGITMLWKHNEEVQLLSFSKNHIDITISSMDRPMHRVIGIYGEPNRSPRDSTWRLLDHLTESSSLPWCVIGDLNNTLYAGDKRGGCPYPNGLIQGFQNCVSNCGLIDPDFVGYSFTWERGRGTDQWVEYRLDRGLVNSCWMQCLPHTQLINLDVSTSDHCPILLVPNNNVSLPIKKLFKFENAWLREPLCVKIINDVWTDFAGSPIMDKLSIYADLL